MISRRIPARSASMSGSSERGGAAAAAAVLLLLTGCSQPVAPDPDAFGAHYMEQAAPAPPVLAGQLLNVTVEYGGCNNNHTFELGYRKTSTTSATLWLHKRTADQPCDMLVIERRSFTVPPTIASLGSIVLLGPGDAEFSLRL